MAIETKKAYRASKIAGIQVRNLEQEKIGVIEDVVIDVEDGDVAYAVLHFQSWFQDKLFAVPWRALTLVLDDDGHHFELDTSRERLKSAPGFDTSDWPNVASDDWREQVDARGSVRIPKGR